MPDRNRTQLAELFIHELGHCLGYQHQLGGSRGACGGTKTIELAYRTEIAALVDSGRFQIREAEAAAKPAIESVISGKLAAAMANLKRASTRLKRAQTLYRKHSKKVRYYETRLEATAAASRAKPAQKPS